ncbi:hypothetical protein G647_07771 [Cladophialophora carrionii CBS 160.54]|uniref:Uncharacterized protein n=1 Tax=Cladophialophora carrionii CBS 160.54 TaxID=1279043 RepID=V9D3F8_9EURO|nr:uncharacterized protein G647_07771 [Cladophialophora carrionii CBS 160.54]ETI21424.1 hypothetical protein G647_07771 [Cladophialophora carrionii CBS 160.54]
MHAIGTSHNCFSCIQADELHENRHRRIAELLAEYKIATGTGPISTRTRTRLEELPVNVPYAQQEVRQFDLLDGELDDEGNDDAQTVTDTTASTADDSERALTAPAKMTKAEVRAMKKASKAAKSQSKAAKNQQRHVINVRAEDVSFVAKVLHGDAANAQGPASATHPLATDKTIEEVIARNMGFLSSIDEHKKALLSSIAQRRRSDRDRCKSASATSSGGSKKRRFSERVNDENPADEEMDDLLVAVLGRLGVDAEHARSCGTSLAVPVVNGGAARKDGAVADKDVVCRPHQVTSIIANLKGLVRDDLERFENEQRETCVRAGGFWRYVGRPVFERMTQIAKELDWKTGMKLKEINGHRERAD